MTQQENCKKPANKRDYSFAANNHRNRSVKAINLSTKEETYYKSMYVAQQNFVLVVGLLKWFMKDWIIVKLVFLR